MSTLALFVLPLALVAAPVDDSPVADAAERRDRESVQALLRSGADVNAAQSDGMTALHWAAMHDDAAMAQVVIYAGANLESTTRLGGYTPLHVAARYGRAGVASVLVNAGSDVHAATLTGVLPIHLAAASAQPDVVRILVEHGADVNATESASGRTALVFATANDRFETLEFLLERGADPSVATDVIDYVTRSEEDGKLRQRRNRMMAALRGTGDEAERGSRRGGVAESAAAQLQSREDDPPEEPAERAEPPAPVNEVSATTVAADAAAELQAREADVEGDAPDSASAGEDSTGDSTTAAEEPRPLSYTDLVGRQGGMAPLHLAARDGRLRAAEILLDASADVNQPTLGDHSTPLLVATINGSYDLAIFLLERGADPTIASEDGATPLFTTLNNRWAPKALYPQPTAFQQQEASYLDLMRALLEHGADVNARLGTHLWYTSYNFDLLGVDFGGATPFWRAAYATDVDAMKLLVEYGADPTVPTAKPPRPRRGSRGPASYSDDDDESGLPPIPVGGAAVYPIHAATGVGYGVQLAANSHRHAPGGWLSAVRYLVEELGADVNARDHDGYTPVHHAAARGDNEVIEYLVAHGADVTLISRSGQTTVDMANGPQQRVQPFPETIALLEGLGAKNNHNCQSC